MSNTPVRIVFGKTLARAALGGREEWCMYLNQPSPAEAIRAVDVNVRGRLREYLSGKGREKLYKIALGQKDNALEKEELRNPSGQQDIYILPMVRGKKSGGAKIVTGLVLAAIAIFAPQALPFALTNSSGALTFAGTIYASTTAALILGGITQLLTPAPGFNQNSEGDSRGSNLLDGNSLHITQGGAVGLVYGRALVTPMPISISFTAYDQKFPNSAAPATATTTYGAGGVIRQTIVPPDPTENLP